MAVDRRQIAENLTRFYDFGNKVVLYAGAGGRQLLDIATMTKVIAIDQDAESLRDLARRDSVVVIGAKFEDVDCRGDVVYFEFCLHEIADPERALLHARDLAADIVVADHVPQSPWSFYAAEEVEVGRAARAVEKFGIRRREAFRTEQRFADYAELTAKLNGQGPVSLQRLGRFAGTTNIVIPMDYQAVLL